jgi:type IV/VI secretion system ImpK/VasF family protein
MRLALVYQEAFKIIVRLQAGKLKKKTASGVKEDLRNALGDPHHHEDSKFAIAAFADETARSHGDLFMEPWEDLHSEPRIVGLTQELFDVAGAGNEFYRRLDQVMSKNTAEAGNVLEVYCLCLLLGYKGARTGVQLNQTIRRTVAQVEQTLGTASALVTGDQFLLEQVPSQGANISRRVWQAMAALALCVGLAYGFFVVNLWSNAAELPSPLGVEKR